MGCTVGSSGRAGQGPALPRADAQEAGGCTRILNIARIAIWNRRAGDCTPAPLEETQDVEPNPFPVLVLTREEERLIVHVPQLSVCPQLQQGRYGVWAAEDGGDVQRSAGRA